MQRPLVSIITPTYDHERFIAPCIRSILAQDVRRWEMIIIDDASRDGTGRIARSYARRDPRIKVLVHGANWGMRRLADTCNQALGLASGQWIAVLEGDDYWPENKLALQLSLVEGKEVVLTYGRALSADACGRVFDERPVPDKAYRRFFADFYGSALLPLLLRPCYIPAVTVMIRKEALDNIGGFSQPLGVPLVDHPTWLRLALEGPFFGASSVLGYYRRHKNARSLIDQAEGTRKEMAVSFLMLKEAEDKGRLSMSQAGLARLRTAMKTSWSGHVVRALWSEGRAALALSRRRAARKSFLQGVTSGPGRAWVSAAALDGKLFCLAGLLFALTPFNLERFLDRVKGRGLSLYESLARERP
jgi:glycosyltransferase involved in cell wall biosynthesis